MINVLGYQELEMFNGVEAELGEVLENEALWITELYNFPFGKQTYGRHKDIHSLWLNNPGSTNLYPQNWISMEDIVIWIKTATLAQLQRKNAGENKGLVTGD